MLIEWITDNEQLNTTWFTADQHFGHANIIDLCNRPFATVDEMDETLIANWNSVVGPDDVVFYLGDFTLGDNATAEHYFCQLNGRIFVLANAWHHDRHWMRLERFTGLPMLSAGQYGLMYSKSDELNHKADYIVNLIPPLCVLEVSAPALAYGKGRPLAITLCHYPLAEWDRKHYGAWHLHGHSHGKHERSGYMLDVGVDSMNYHPVNIGGILDYMYSMGWS